MFEIGDEVVVVEIDDWEEDFDPPEVGSVGRVVYISRVGTHPIEVEFYDYESPDDTLFFRPHELGVVNSVTPVQPIESFL